MYSHIKLLTTLCSDLQWDLNALAVCNISFVEEKQDLPFYLNECALQLNVSFPYTIHTSFRHLYFTELRAL
jgi:hypothetical protein